MAYEKFCQLFQKIKDDKDIELLRKYYLADFSKRVVDAHYRIILSTACLSILKEPTVFVKAIFDQVCFYFLIRMSIPLIFKKLSLLKVSHIVRLCYNYNRNIGGVYVRKCRSVYTEQYLYSW